MEGLRRKLEPLEFRGHPRRAVGLGETPGGEDDGKPRGQSCPGSVHLLGPATSLSALTMLTPVREGHQSGKDLGQRGGDTRCVLAASTLVVWAPSLL